jgi:hypothetical protein
MRFDDIVGRVDRSWFPFAAILATAPSSPREMAGGNRKVGRMA